MKKRLKPRNLPKAERRTRALHQRVGYERSKATAIQRDNYLRSLMGLPARQESRPL
jgi:hypothetical protein